MCRTTNPEIGSLDMSNETRNTETGCSPMLLLKTGRRQWIGTREDLVRLQQELKEQGIGSRLLNTDGTRATTESTPETIFGKR